MWINQTDYHLQTPAAGFTDAARADLREVMSGIRGLDVEDVEAGVLTMTMREVAHGSSLERCEEAAEALGRRGLARPVRVWSTPYETLGVVVYHVPGLGIWNADCDHEGEPYLPGHDLIPVIETAPSPDVHRIVRNRLGTPWREAFESYGDHAPGDPEPGEQHRRNVARAAVTTSYADRHTLLEITHDYAMARNAYVEALAAWHDQPDGEDIPASVTDPFDRLTLIREAIHRRGCRLEAEGPTSVRLILPIGAAFTIR